MKKKILLLSLLICAMITIVAFKTYSLFHANLSVEVSSYTSNIICDAEILEVSSNEKDIYGYSEFKVKVKNYDADENITGENFNYTLNVSNKSGSNGEFKYDGNFTPTLSINGTMSNSDKENSEYIIKVKSSNGQSENVEYDVNIDCIQSN